MNKSVKEQDETGQARSVTELHAETVEFLDGRRGVKRQGNSSHAGFVTATSGAGAASAATVWTGPVRREGTLSVASAIQLPTCSVARGSHSHWYSIVHRQRRRHGGRQGGTNRTTGRVPPGRTVVLRHVHHTGPRCSKYAALGDQHDHLGRRSAQGVAPHLAASCERTHDRLVQRHAPSLFPQSGERRCAQSCLVGR